MAVPTPSSLPRSRTPIGSAPLLPDGRTSASQRAGPEREHTLHRRGLAIAWLLFATVLWGASFPLNKALVIAQIALVPAADTWDLTALDLALRFGLAAGVVALSACRTFPRHLTGQEASQGVGLGLFAFLGMLFQLDGLNYTAASTSSFLTTTYCMIIPLFVAVRRRQLPPALVATGCALAAAGIAVLAGVDSRTLRLGRGEIETIIGSLCFAAQILWLERPAYACNRTSHATAVMFATLAFGSAAVILLHARHPASLLRAAVGSVGVISCLLGLTIFCTIITFSLMNHWQRHVEASEAGLIYCAEPLWTSLFALFLPACLAAVLGVAYTNEHPTARLLVGGGLVTAANICIQLRRKKGAIVEEPATSLVV